MIVGVYETRRFSESAEELDRLSEGYLSNILRKGDLDGKVGQNASITSRTECTPQIACY